uniref:Uncharacterized protein n=1 Tax=Tanacetum cinerariifolium TaxID=118510 RepID=A0A6L2JB16_TANCI|nr:hypothetical protein [Tanacetum cinerariifolium]
MLDKPSQEIESLAKSVRVAKSENRSPQQPPQAMMNITHEKIAIHGGRVHSYLGGAIYYGRRHGGRVLFNLLLACLSKSPRRLISSTYTPNAVYIVWVALLNLGIVWAVQFDVADGVLSKWEQFTSQVESISSVKPYMIARDADVLTSVTRVDQLKGLGDKDEFLQLAESEAKILSQAARCIYGRLMHFEGQAEALHRLANGLIHKANTLYYHS